MITEQTATRFGIAAIVLMVALLVLVGFHVVPPSWELPLFIAAVALFAARLVVRTMLARRRRQAIPPSEPPTIP